MKAWLVQDKWDSYGAEIVFAETRGKARSLALSTDCCSETHFLDVDVRRMQNADKYYKEGKWHLDWDNPKDRIDLVKDCGFVCDYEYLEWEDCESCSAKDYCDRYADHIADTPTEKGECTGKRCPMQVGYDVKNCKDKDCIYRTEKGGK